MTTPKTLVVFFAIAYAWAWLVFVPLVIVRGPLEWTVVAAFGPTIAALVTHRVTTGNYRAFRLSTTWPRMLGATAVGVALMLLAYVVLPGVTTADPRTLHWSVLISPAVYNYSTLLGGPLGEEPGWRGYALPRLESALGPVRSSLVLGLLWTGWHLPLFLYPGWTSSPLWIYVLFLTGQSLILTYGTNLARFSILTPIAMHATFNTVSRFLSGLFAGTQPSAPIPFELVMALGGVAIALVLILATRGQHAYRHEPAARSIITVGPH
ncbi:MAG: CPBP family intramembrane glutamic endopeptidase [Acidobacteriota bacterium]